MPLGQDARREAALAASREALKRAFWRLDSELTLPESRERRSSSATTEEDDGLLHDAGNLIGAVALYCDLLSMPHVLRPEHRHYADELRLLGERSAAMIERLMERRTAGFCTISPAAADVAGPGDASAAAASRGSGCGAEGLRPAVERCVGVLDRIAREHAVEVTYGEASALPVRVPAESVERILINLVRNAAAAMPGSRGSIRIGVGLLPGQAENIVCPWPFQRVRLTVEDCGRGMEPEQVEGLLAEEPLTSRHGIGFRVVRELVKASGGELAVRSQPGCGTRIQMEWPVAQPMEQEIAEGGASPMTDERRRASWQS